jgi:hypothetical protein
MQYERTLYDVDGIQRTDPRITHVVTLATDGYGNVRQSATIAYGRRLQVEDPLLSAEDLLKQRTTLTVYTENDYTNAVEGAGDHRVPLPAESRTFEIHNLATGSGQQLLSFEALRPQLQLADDGTHELPYEDFAADGAVDAAQPYRRLIEHTRTRYRRDDLDGPLPVGIAEARALPYESYRKAFTPGLATSVYVSSGKLTAAELDEVLVEGGYVRVDGDAGWWIPSGRVFFHPEPGATAAGELAAARQHFFLPRRFLDPFQNATRVRYDDYDLLALETEDALHNKVTAGERHTAGLIEPRIDYRVLQPTLTTDPNGNRSLIAHDVLGLPVGSAVMGKRTESLGDSLQGFTADLDAAQIDAFFADPRGTAAGVLGTATTRIIYDVNRYFNTGDPEQPPFVASILREQHVSALAPGAVSPVQVAFAFSDGFSREIQMKVQAEAGPVDEGGPDVAFRWVGKGWTVFNNKAKPVRKYEPFFTADHDFEFARAMGVSPR